MPQGLANSSWGRPRRETDARALRIYRRFLSLLSTVGEAINVVLLIAMFSATIKLLVFTNFENLIPYDGTAVTCVLDGSTQGLSNVQ